jgi:hypothetical protein
MMIAGFSKAEYRRNAETKCRTFAMGATEKKAQISEPRSCVDMDRGVSNP